MEYRIKNKITFDKTIYISLGHKLNTIDDLEKYSDNILDIVSANVKKYREEKGLTQMQLALEIGLTGGAYLGRAEIKKITITSILSI